ncbi:glucokinase [Roseovarius halotolerans]|uniref:Glucokinase n=1 Tax=Roseovarius halotolerans TaxID=505353 RepID=A0A1X6YYC5_9RHOB|nr:glucokinase [Roseovarius halotolerans]RKT32597.1 glucokinase [Roseovarius halotolerans]SLN34945.1 Glucokinase [Roseovarius halotolerans]
MSERHLLADVGGTNTRVGLADARGLLPDTVRIYENAGFDGLAPLLAAYLCETEPGPIDALCAGVAGPVRDGDAQLTNHDWFIAAADLAAATGAARVRLINDLQAQGYALDDVPPAARVPLFDDAPPPPDATRLVLGLGTGCNVAVVHQSGGRLFVPPAESGHSALPHMADAQASALIRHLAETHPHCPVEAALSGPGLMRIHRWLGGAALSSAQIVTAHEQRTDPRATQALTLFATILGAVAGNLCLHHLPMGGLYLIGGTARAIAPHLRDLGFAAPFTARGPYSAIMRDIPVTLIADDTIALAGCARHLRQTAHA